MPLAPAQRALSAVRASELLVVVRPVDTTCPGQTVYVGRLHAEDQETTKPGRGRASRKV